jgi:hypothetical protein
MMKKRPSMTPFGVKLMPVRVMDDPIGGHFDGWRVKLMPTGIIDHAILVKLIATGIIGDAYRGDR